MKNLLLEIKELFERKCKILWLSAKIFVKNNQAQHATSLTFYTLFAVVPILALCFGIAKGFNLDEKLKVIIVERFAEQQDIVDWMYKFADTTLKQADGGIIAGVGVIFLFWTVIRLATFIEKSFNQAWNILKGRNLFRKISDFLALLLIAPILFVILSSSSILFKNMLEKVLENSQFGEKAISLVSFGFECLPLVVTWVIFVFIYVFVPHTKVQFKSGLFAGLFAAILYQAIQAFYIAVQLKVSSFNSIYGSFAALPLFLIWVQWAWLITLFGNQIAYVDQYYKTGQFDKNFDRISSELLLKYLILTLKEVVCSFEHGKIGLTVEELSAKTELSHARIQEVLYILMNAKLISKVDVDDVEEYIFVPAMPTDKMSLALAIQKIRHIGENDSVIWTDVERNKVNQLIDNLYEDIFKSERNCLIRDI
jgi:membrane protein